MNVRYDTFKLYGTDNVWTVRKITGNPGWEQVTIVGAELSENVAKSFADILNKGTL